MPTTLNELSDVYRLLLTADDQLSKPVADATARLGAFLQTSENAAKTLENLGKTTTGTEGEFVKASATWERAARRNDDLSASMQKLKSAEEELARTTKQAATELERGATTGDVVDRVITRLTANVEKAKQAVVAMRDAIDAANQANDTWQAGLASGDEQLLALSAAAQTASANIAKANAETLIYGKSLDQMRASISGVTARSLEYDRALVSLATSAKALGLSSAQIKAEWDKLNAAFAAGGATADATRAKYDALFAENLRHAEAMKTLQTEITQNLLQGADVQAAALAKINAEHAKTVAALDGTTAAQNKTTASAEKEAAALATLSEQLNNLRARFDSVFRVSMDYAKSLSVIDAALAAGIIQGPQYNRMLDQINAAMAKGQTSTQALTKSSGEAGFAVRQLGVQSVQFFSSIEAGTDVFTAFIQQGHQVVDVALATGTGFDVIGKAAKAAWGWMTSAKGLVIEGIVAVAVAVGSSLISFEVQERQLLRLQNQLRATRMDYESLATTVDRAARNVAATSTAGTGAAREAGATIAATPQFSGSQRDLEAAIRLSNDLAAVWGVKLPEAAKKVAMAFSDPAKLAKELAEQHLPGMNAELARTIELMEASGQHTDATNQTLEAMKNASSGASSNLTSLQTAMNRLSEAFTRTGEGGRSLAQILGDTFSGAVAIAVNALSRLVEAINAARGLSREAAKNTEQFGPPAPPRPNRLSDWFGGTTPKAPEQFGPPAPTENEMEASRKLLENVTGSVKLLNEAQAAWNDSAAGHVQLLTARIEGLNKELAKPDVQNNAVAVKNLSDEIRALSLARDADAARAGDQRTATEKTIDATNEQTSAIVEGTAAIRAGGAGLIEVEARHKAIAQALAANLNPLTQAYTDAVRDNTAANIANANATADRKTANDSLNLDYQIKLLSAETDALILNTQAARDNVEATKRAELARREIEAGRDPNIAAAQHEQISRLTELKKLEGEATAAITRGGGAGKAGLYDAENARFRARQAQLSAQPYLSDTEVAEYNKLTLAIKGNEKAMADATKAHAVHRDQIDKNVDKLAADTKAHNDMADAILQGDDAVLQLTASMKAQEQAIANNLKPGQDNYNEAVKRGTAAQLANLTAINRVKAAQDQMDTAQQIKLVQAETASLGDNADQRSLMLQHMKDEYEINKKMVGLSPEMKAAALAQKDALASLTQELQNRQQTMQYLSQQFTQAFDTIGNAMTQAFISGEGKAVNWGNVMKSVIQQVIQAFAKLAIINPILNSVLGQNNPTLGSVLNILGGSGSGSSTSSSGSALAAAAGAASVVGGGFAFGSESGTVTPTTRMGSGFVDSGTWDLSSSSGGRIIQPSMASSTGGASGVLSTASNLFNLSKLTDAFGFSNIGGQFSNFTNSIGLTGSGGLFGSGGTLGGITSFLNTPITGGLGAADASVMSAMSGVSGAGALPEAGLVGAGASTIGQALGGIGTGFALGSMAGGLLQGALGKTGPGPTIGAGVGSVAGAALGTFVFPVVGTMVGAILGGILGGAGGGLIGPHPASPFSSTYVGVGAGGQLNVGQTRSQMVDASTERQSAINDVNVLNKAMSDAGVRATGFADNVNGAGRALSNVGSDLASIQIGQNSPDGTPDPSKFQDLASAFPSLRFAANDPLVNVGVAGRSFATAQEFVGVTKTLNDFVTAMKGNAYEFATGNIISRFAGPNVAAADIQPVLQEASTFFTATLPSLLNKNKGSLYDSLKSTAETYDAAITHAQKLGFAELELTQQRVVAMDKIKQAVIDEQNTANKQLDLRKQVADATRTGDLASIQAANLAATDQASTDALKVRGDALVAIYGDAFRGTQAFADQMVIMERTQASERLNIVKANNEAILQLENQRAALNLQLYDKEAAARAAYSGSPFDLQAVQRSAANTDAIAQRNALRSTLLGQGTQEGTPAFTSAMESLNRTIWFTAQTLERTQAQATADAYVGRANTTQGFNLRAASATAQRGSSYDQLVVSLQSFDLQADIERRNLRATLRSTWGEAYAAVFENNQQIVALDKALASERLNIAEASKDALLQTASATIIPLSEYARSLKFSDKSPLSPTAQFTAARSEFQAVSGAAAAGDFESIQKFQTYADTYLTSARTMFGSTKGYIDAFEQVTQGLAAISENTATSITQTIITETQTQTQILNKGLEDLKQEVIRLNGLLQNRNYAPDRAAA